MTQDSSLFPIQCKTIFFLLELTACFPIRETGLKSRILHFSWSQNNNTHLNLRDRDRQAHRHTEQPKEQTHVGSTRQRERGKKTVWQKKHTNEQADRERGGNTSWRAHTQVQVEVRESQAYGNTNDYEDGQIDREGGIRVIMWVRQRQAGRQINMSACFCCPQ